MPQKSNKETYGIAKQTVYKRLANIPYKDEIPQSLYNEHQQLTYQYRHCAVTQVHDNNIYRNIGKHVYHHRQDKNITPTLHKQPQHSKFNQDCKYESYKQLSCHNLIN